MTNPTGTAILSAWRNPDKAARRLIASIGIAIGILLPTTVFGNGTAKTVPSAAGTYSFEVTVPSGSLTYHGFSSSEGWLSFARFALRGTALTLSFRVDANTSSSSRTATLSGTVVNNEQMTFTVIQEGVSGENGGSDNKDGNGSNGGMSDGNGLAQSMTVGHTAGSYTFSGASATGTMSYLTYTSSEPWLTTPSSEFTSSSSGGWSFSVTFAISENPSPSDRTAVITGTSDGKNVASFTVVQKGNPQKPVPAPIPDDDFVFGPGHGSEFCISPGEKGFVVGVYGLTWDDFPKRAFDGCNVFSDSRIVDREKRSGSDAPDHTFCVDYSYLDILLWGGWVSGFTDEDVLGERLVNGGGELYAAMERAQSHMTEVSTGSTFAKTLADGMAKADRMLAMTVWFDNYTWYGERFSGRPGIGHGIVCCGYSFDPNKALSDPTALKGLFVIESDNDRENGGGSASAPDTITYCPVSWDSSNRRYSIRNIFGATGYFDDSIDGGAFMIGAAKAVEPNVSRKGEGGCGSLPDDGAGKLDTSFSKAQTVTSKLVDDQGDFVGIVQIKAGKKNGKNIVKISAAATLLNGKKVTAKAINVSADGGDGTLSFKSPVGAMSFKMDADGTVYLHGGTYAAESAEQIGGLLDVDQLTFSVNVESEPNFGNGWEILGDALPEGVPIDVINGGKKWSLRKAPVVKYKKFRDEGETWY
ncbi:MAG: BACON domain-containing protein, partial [Kiritimatiellae bacterium]|nr:BACON domain-containing protein [Kiritimatiellia bacterium]